VAPTGPIGPGDVGPTPTGRLLLRTLSLPVVPVTDTVTNFADVRDMARACVSVLRRARPALSVFNVGSGRAVALSEIVRILRAGARREIRLEIEESRIRPGELQSIALDTSRLRRATGWSPAIPLERSVIDTLDYWRSSVVQFK